MIITTQSQGLQTWKDDTLQRLLYLIAQTQGLQRWQCHLRQALSEGLSEE